MKRKPRSQKKRTTTKSVLRLPEIEHVKVAVLNSLTSLDAQRGYRHAIDEFVDGLGFALYHEIKEGTMPM